MWRDLSWLFYYTFTAETDGEKNVENRSTFGKGKSRMSCFFSTRGE